MQKVCTKCGSLSEPIRKRDGDIFTGVFRYIMAAVFFVVGFFTFVISDIFAIIFWVISLIFLFAAIKNSAGYAKVTEKCPKCNSSDMVPTDTPIGKKIIEEFKTES